MTKILAVLDMVPAWVWAVLVGVLLALCIRLDLLRLQANADASKARADLMAVQLASARAIGLERERSRREEMRLTAAVLEVQDALAQEKAGRAGRVDALSGRLRNVARPLLCRPGGGGAPTPTGRSDGQPDPGLPGVAGAGVVVLDGQGLSDLANLAESAADTGRTLTHARRLLRECWKSEAVPVAP